MQCDCSKLVIDSTFPEYEWTRPKSPLLLGGMLRTYDYDGFMRLKSIDVKDSAQVRDTSLGSLLKYGYGFDKMDNIISKTTPQVSYGYWYDALYPLTNVTVSTQTNNESFTYDAVGNRRTYNNSAEWYYSINNELSSTSNVMYDYDANGNTITKLVTCDSGDVGCASRTEEYVYGIENRLIEVKENNATIASYAYDPFDRRVKKTVGWAAPTGTTSTYYFYSDEGLIAEYNAEGNQQKAYGYKPGSTFTTDPQWMKQGGQYYYYQNDHLGTPQMLTTASGTVVWSAQYTAFGKADVTAFGVVNNLRFPGQYYDEETGLHYNHMRYYDTGTGKYISPDPVSLSNIQY